MAKSKSKTVRQFIHEKGSYDDNETFSAKWHKYSDGAVEIGLRLSDTTGSVYIGFTNDNKQDKKSLKKLISTLSKFYKKF